MEPPIVALSSAALIPLEGEGGPKDATDKRVDTFLKRSFEATALALKAASATSVMARVAFVWAKEVSSSSKLSKKFRSQLKKIYLAAAFASDSSYDALQLSARALASNTVATCNLWLRQWDSASLSRVVNRSFQGAKLFEQGLEPLLVENKDKRKVLPSGKPVLSFLILLL